MPPVEREGHTPAAGGAEWLLEQMRRVAPLSYGALTGALGVVAGLVLVRSLTRDIPLDYLVGGVVLLSPLMFVIYGIEKAPTRLEIKVLVRFSIAVLLAAVFLVFSSVFFLWPRDITLQAPDSPENLARIAEFDFDVDGNSSTLKRSNGKHWEEIDGAGGEKYGYTLVSEDREFFVFRRENSDYNPNDSQPSAQFTFIRIPPLGGRVEWSLSNYAAGSSYCYHDYCWGDVGPTRVVLKSDDPNGTISSTGSSAFGKMRRWWQKT